MALAAPQRAPQVARAAWVQTVQATEPTEPTERAQPGALHRAPEEAAGVAVVDAEAQMPEAVLPALLG